MLVHASRLSDLLPWCLHYIEWLENTSTDDIYAPLLQRRPQHSGEQIFIIDDVTQATACP
jgi:hypothetical protein